jgi:uncharacterized damage-inducible protein DinB
MTIDGVIKAKTIANFWIFEVKPPLMKAIEIVPEDKLDWAPAEGMLSLGNLFMHINEASAWWIDKIIDDLPYKDMTPCPSVSKQEILAMLEEHWQRLDNFFARSPEIIEKTYEFKKPDKTLKFEGHWILLHLLEHDIHHRCQINQYLRILGITPPEI